GQTVYQMNVRVDSTVQLRSTNWDVYVPLDRFTLAPPPLQPQIPTTNDYFEGVAMDPGANFVDTTIDANWVLSANTRNTNGAFGPTGTGDLENVYFTVNTDAPLGPVTCQNCVENIAAFAFNFSDPQGALYTIGNGSITTIDGTYNIVEPGDMNFDNSVNTGDIPAFISALLDPVQYQADFDAGLVGSADSNLDGVIDARDIQGFVDRILAGP
ncbi:MAG: dockerin type I domain-containing protein, partial [Phycisphaerae bacterium]